MDFSYYDILIRGLDESVCVSRLVHGVAWTAAVLSDGRCGVAMHTTGDTVPRMYGSLIGLPADEAGRAVLSWNMEEASEALAVINAFYNRRDCGFLQSIASSAKAMTRGASSESVTSSSRTSAAGMRSASIRR